MHCSLIMLSSACSPCARLPFTCCVQNDYFVGGSSPLPGSSAALLAINQLRTLYAWNFVFIVGYHRPPNHVAFASNNPGAMLGETIPIPDVGTFTMQPDVCIQGSWGAKFHRDLVIEETDIVNHYAFNPRVDQRTCKLRF